MENIDIDKEYAAAAESQGKPITQPHSIKMSTIGVSVRNKKKLLDLKYEHKLANYDEVITLLLFNKRSRIIKP